MSSNRRWSDVTAVLRGLQLLTRSQMGFEMRSLEMKLSRKCENYFRTSVGSIQQPVRDTSQPTNAVQDVLERAETVAIGMKQWIGLLNRGIKPGDGGQISSVLDPEIRRNIASEVTYSNIESAAFRSRNVESTQQISVISSTVAETPKSIIKAATVAETPKPIIKAAAVAETPKPIIKAAAVAETPKPIITTAAVAETPKPIIKAATVAETPKPIITVAETPDSNTHSNTESVAPRSRNVESTQRNVLSSTVAEIPKSITPSPQKKKPRFIPPELPKDFDIAQRSAPQQLSNRSHERAVPSSRIGRAYSFGSLAVGLGAGAVAEFTRRTFGFGDAKNDTVMETVLGGSNVFLTPANAERIVQTLCRVRGAALKLGQMLSIQDSTLINPALLEILERVRYSADFMPVHQVHKMLRQEFGDNWREKVADFDEKPFAAASIGQVHRAVLHDGREVALKIQYPGVADGIDSDIDNLVSILNFGGLFPKGAFLEEFVRVARAELKLECDYRREARAMTKFRELLLDDKHFYVPKVISELTTKRVLTAELISGVPVDKCVDQPQAVRNYIATKFIELCLKEIFQWRFMQTDPNWSNFFFGQDPNNGEWRLVLLDFGATRSYDKKFVDQYMNIIKAAYDKDEQKMLKYSRDIGFLTGYESKVMEKAHCEAISIMGETLASDAPYDFSRQDVTKRIHHLIPVMLEHRLTPPPEEIYSLHRKLSGSYLLATKLKATVACGPLFSDIHANYQYGPGPMIDIDSEPDE